MVREVLTLEMLGALEPRDAAALFIARRAEGLSPREQQLLNEWLAEDEAHRSVFASADAAWRSFDDAQGDEILGAMRAHALAPPQRRVNWLPIAGAVAAACAAFMLLVPGLNPWSPSTVRAEYASVRGEVRDVELPDGSVMTLDADSAAATRFGENLRSVDLERGRAFFDVASDATRRFVVTASNRRVLALGTRFDVNIAGDALIVTLLEGRVSIEAQDGGSAPVTLEPGQQYVERDGEATVRAIAAASENVAAWRTGFISFDDQPLSEATAVMNRYSQAQIAIHDRAVGALRVSGQFRAGETERFAQTLAEMHSLQIARRGDELELVRQ